MKLHAPLLCGLVCLVSGISLPPPTSLVTEYLHEPAGIDVTPRFSWGFDALAPGVQRGSQQSAYQIQVADGPFDTDLPLWDSGRVVANSSILIAYAGPQLAADVLFFWRVRAWVEKGLGPTDFSATASFHTGLSSPSDWAGAAWITGANGSNLLRVNFSLPAGRRVLSATAYLVGIGYAALSCNGQRVGAGRRLESAWTSYAHRVRYVSLDASVCLAAAPPDAPVVMGVALGNGWFACRGWYAQPPYAFPQGEQSSGGGLTLLLTDQLPHLPSQPRTGVAFVTIRLHRPSSASVSRSTMARRVVSSALRAAACQAGVLLCPPFQTGRSYHPRGYRRRPSARSPSTPFTTERSSTPASRLNGRAGTRLVLRRRRSAGCRPQQRRARRTMRLYRLSAPSLSSSCRRCRRSAPGQRASGRRRSTLGATLPASSA